MNAPVKHCDHCAITRCPDCFQRDHGRAIHLCGMYWRRTRIKGGRRR